MRAKLLEDDNRGKKHEPLPSHRSGVSGRSMASDSLTCRNYTCEVKSIFATVYFLKIEDFMNFYKYIPQERVRTGVALRLKLLQKQMKMIKQFLDDDIQRANIFDKVPE